MKKGFKIKNSRILKLSTKDRFICFKDSLFMMFTLVELLIVIAIIAVLISMLFPALNKAKEYSKSINCVGNLRQIGAAAFVYVDDYNNYLPRFEWLRAETENKMSCQKMTYKPVSHYYKDASGYGWNYWYLGDPAASTHGYYVKLKQVRKPSLTLMAGDTADWINQYETEIFKIFFYGSAGPDPAIGNRHMKGVNYVWCDGHVEYKKQVEMMSQEGIDYFKREK